MSGRHGFPLGALIVLGLSSGAIAQGVVAENSLGEEGTQPLFQHDWRPKISEPESSASWLSGVAVGARTWISWGQADRNHAANNSRRFVDPISDLRWRNMVSESAEVGASALLFDRLVINAEAGIGGISGGNFRDQDFLISGRRGLFSDTISPITNDDLQYFNAEVGWRFYEDDRWSVDGLIGYQYWREKYVAEGGSDIVPGRGSGFPLGPVITEDFTWQGFRIGGQSIYQFSPHCALKSRVMLMPLTHFENVDIHHLRTDLRKNPSIIDRADGGFGVMADIRLCYCLWKGLSLDLGYRVWDATSGQGETIFRFTNGNGQFPFNEGNTTRQGLILGLNYQF